MEHERPARSGRSALWSAKVRVTRLEIGNLRRFRQASLTPGGGLNLITGGNGAGKTTLLEALHLMAYGRSFRGRVHEGLIRHGADALDVFVEWRENAPVAGAASDGPLHRAGLHHAGRSWQGRLDGAGISHLGELCAALAVVTLEPGSHALIMGPGETRRRFVDWGLFHVEPGFLPLWRRYARALKQRNALLKARGNDQLEAWEHEMAAAGEPLTRYRERYLEQLQGPLRATMADLLPAAGDSVLEFQPGWRSAELALADALLLARDRDLATGFSSVGPHRADWSVVQPMIPGRTALSRGQAKLTALSMLLAQAEHHAGLRGEWPIMALDDMASELDRVHQRRVLARIFASGAQIFLTGTEAPPVLVDVIEHTPVSRFHVEHGQITAEETE